MFRPWIGSRYGRNHGNVEHRNAFGHDVLVVGESHYSDEINELPDRDFTRRVVQHLGIDGAAHDRYYFKRTARVLRRNRCADHNACAAIWEDVAFCNLVQRIMHTREEDPTRDDFDDGATALVHALHALRPDLVLVTSLTAWGYVEPLAEKAPFAEIHFDRIYHPAQPSGLFRYESAIPVFQGLLDRLR